MSGTRSEDEEQCAEAVPCEHYWASRSAAGKHLVRFVRQCMICHQVDLDDLDAEVGIAIAAAMAARDQVIVSRADFRRVMLAREDDLPSEEYDEARRCLHAAARRA